MLIEINGKQYNVRTAKDDESKKRGLMGVDSMPDNEGMLFFFDKEKTVSFWMKDTKIDLDVIFIDGDNEVISVAHGIPFSEQPMKEDDVKYVLELNHGSGVQEDDEMEIIDDKAMVLGSGGEIQMVLEGGERIFSRKNTRTLIKMSYRANKSKTDTAYKKLGRKVFKYIHTQDTQTQDYVPLPEK